MAAEVVFAPSADGDLDSIAGYIAQDNPRAAVALIRDLRARCLSLKDFPLRGRRFNAEHRTLVASPYLIFYRVQDDTVVIVRIRHGAQDVDRLFPVSD
jgi:toxin ParE1/3/4